MNTSNIGSKDENFYDKKLVEPTTQLVHEYRKRNIADALLEGIKEDPENTIKNLIETIGRDVSAEKERSEDENAMSSMMDKKNSNENITIYHQPGLNNGNRRTPEWLNPYKKGISEKEKEGINKITSLIKYKHDSKKMEDEGKIKPKDGQLKKIYKRAEEDQFTKGLTRNWEDSIELQKSGFLESAKSALLYWNESDKNSEPAKIHLDEVRKESNTDTIDIFKTINDLRDNEEKATRLKQISEILKNCDDIQDKQDLEREALILLHYEEFKGDKNDPEYEKKELEHAMKNSVIHNYMESDKDNQGNINDTKKKEFWANLNKTLEKDINNSETCLETFCHLQISTSENNINNNLEFLRKEDAKRLTDIQKNNPEIDLKNAVSKAGHEIKSSSNHLIRQGLNITFDPGDQHLPSL